MKLYNVWTIIVYYQLATLSTDSKYVNKLNVFYQPFANLKPGPKMH